MIPHNDHGSTPLAREPREGDGTLPNRRSFLTAASAAAAATLAGSGGCSPTSPDGPTTSPKVRLAGMTLPELKRHYEEELFDSLLPFWEEHGIDNEYGGIITGLDYDGAQVDSNKLLSHQGRGLWVYSHLYNRFGQQPRYLEIVGRVKEFLFQHARQPDGWWAELLSREGEVVRPYQGYIYGQYFLAEGLQEYAHAAGDDEARDVALDLLKRLYAEVEKPDFRDPGCEKERQRSQGIWMVNLQTATQILNHWDDPEVARIAGHSFEALFDKHFNPEICLYTEVLNQDFTRPAEERYRCMLGGALQCLWIAMEEAQRRRDDAILDTCVERIGRHFDIGWDHVYGGLAEWVNVGQGCYQWPELLAGYGVRMPMTGEYHYMKSEWALNEVLVATLKAYEHSRAWWAADAFGLAQKTSDEKFSLRSQGYSTYISYADRKITFQPGATRQDNYHPEPRLMMNLLTIQRLMEQETTSQA